MEPANRRPAPGAWSLSLSANTAVTCELAASGRRQPGPFEVGATYGAVLSGSVAPSEPSGRLKPTAIDTDPSESGVLMDTSERRMFQDMSEPMFGSPDGTIDHAHEDNACVPAGQRPNKTPIFISAVSDPRSFLAWLRVSCTGGLMAQEKGESRKVFP